MKYRNIYEECKTLALLYGYIQKNAGGSEFATYFDSFGCDFQIYYSNVMYYGTGRMHESMGVYLGGRKVYEFYEEYPDQETFVDGNWTRLIPMLSRYEYDADVGRVFMINNTLLELCKRESIRNREILNKYCKLCLLIVRKRGVISDVLSDGARDYEYEKIVDGHVVEIFLHEVMPKFGIDSEDSIVIIFDNDFVFSFRYNSSNAGGIFDNKGEYVPGEWEWIMEGLADE